MAMRTIRELLANRMAEADLQTSSEQLTQLATYLELLARWNRRINLTGFDLSQLSDAAIDRLIIEPVAASRHVLASDRIAIDIGSGGGSPGLSMKIASPGLRVVLVEVKARKSAFLREAIRKLGLTDVEVETRRAEELLLRADLAAAADLITFRAVRADADLWRTLGTLLHPAGRVFWFTSGKATNVPSPFAVAQHDRLLPASELVIARKGP